MSNSGSLQRPLPPLSEDFPLKQHKTGKFRKTIKGKDYYFGRREDPEPRISVPSVTGSSRVTVKATVVEALIGLASMARSRP